MVILLPGTLGSSSVLTSFSTSLRPRRFRWSSTCALSARNHVPAASAPTNTKAAPATIHRIFLNEILIAISIQLKKLCRSTIYVKGTEGIQSTILSIYVDVFPRLTVPSFFAREKLPVVQGDLLAY